MGYRTVLGLVLVAAVGMAQHVPFGSPVNGFPVGRLAMDSQGNLVDLTQTLALGLCCGVRAGLGDIYRLKAILVLCYIVAVEWVVEFVDEFEKWWDTLSESEQEKVAARVQLLIERGPNLGFPYSSNVLTSKFPEMRELRAQAGGDPLRMLYAFDARRAAILLLGGDKTGNDRWYQENVPIADRRFERHLRTIEKERAKHG